VEGGGGRWRGLEERVERGSRGGALPKERANQGTSPVDVNGEVDRRSFGTCLTNKFSGKQGEKNTGQNRNVALIQERSLPPPEPYGWRKYRERKKRGGAPHPDLH